MISIIDSLGDVSNVHVHTRSILIKELRTVLQFQLCWRASQWRSDGTLNLEWTANRASRLRVYRSPRRMHPILTFFDYAIVLI